MNLKIHKLYYIYRIIPQLQITAPVRNKLIAKLN